MPNETVKREQTVPTRKHMAVVVDTSRSPQAKLRPLALTQVRMEDSFWAPRMELNRAVMLREQYRQCEETGRLDNFRRVAGTYNGPFQGRYFNDSDVYKWLEAACWTLATYEDAELKAMVDRVIEVIASAQDENGYLNTYFSLERAGERWSNLVDMHELYCAGHLFQAAIAHHRATGEESLLTIAVRLADHIAETFGPGKLRGACGHPEIEMALVELARDTGNRRYLELSQFFIDQRGQHLPTMSGREYDQDHAPVREQREIVGHAVRALYLYGGVTDIYSETGEAALLEAVEGLWQNFVERKMYITGGAGARYEGEAFGADYELPNERAYAETCAAIASVMWNWRRLQINGEARFADTLERALYNCVLSGVSLDGQTYFYQNPLADQGKHRRQPWFGTACCPPNIARTLAALPGYLYSQSDEGLWVHLYASSTVSIDLPTGQSIQVRQRSDYPWSGTIRIEVEPAQPASFSLFLRIPAWTSAASISINGQPGEEQVQPGNYLELRREWRPGDRVELTLPMEVQAIESHPFVSNNHDRVALTRGPLVYCVEQVDHAEGDVRTMTLVVGNTWTEARVADLPAEIVALRTDASLAEYSQQELPLYQHADEYEVNEKTVTLTAIPYYAWANRAAGPMVVWLPGRADIL